MRPALVLALCLTLVLAALGGAWLARRSEPVPPPETAPRAAFEPEDWAARRVEVAAPELEPTAAEAPAAAVEARWVETNREAIAALEAGELERAVELFEECVRGAPEEPVFARNAAEALARLAVRDHAQRNPCAECIPWLERAHELAPEREDLRRLLERWRAEAELERGFWRDSSLHFDLAYDGFRSELLWGSARILEELERIYTDLGLLFGFHPVDEGAARIRVVLYERAGFSALTGLGEWAGGAFDGTVRGPLGDFEREEAGLGRVLRHEVVHYFVRAAGGNGVPGWLNEGLAQRLEGSGAAYLASARSSLAKGGALFPLAELEGNLSGWSDPRAITRAYEQSLVFCDHLARQYGEQILFDMVAASKEGETAAARFAKLTRVELATALGDLAQELAR
jgi:hypothetical protein